MIKEETVFKIDKEHPRCPSIIQLQQFDGSGFANGRKAEKDDLPFKLGGYKEEKNKYFLQFESIFSFDERQGTLWSKINLVYPPACSGR